MSQKLFNAFVDLSESYHKESSKRSASEDKSKKVPGIQKKKAFQKKAKMEYNKNMLTKNLKSMLNNVKKYTDKNKLKAQNIKYLKLMNERSKVTDKIKQIILNKKEDE